MSNTKNYGKCHPKEENDDLLTLVIIRMGDSVFQEIDDKDKNGKITAKGKGSCIIKAKVTLKNGTEKTIKIKVTV